MVSIPYRVHVMMFLHTRLKGASVTKNKVSIPYRVHVIVENYGKAKGDTSIVSIPYRVHVITHPVHGCGIA